MHYVSIKNPIIEYTRDRKNNKNGVILSGINNGIVCFGFSLCSKEDYFDSFIGVDIAEARAFKNDRLFKNLIANGDTIPISIKEYLPKFIDRVTRYYKSEKFSDYFEYIRKNYGRD